MRKCARLFWALAAGAMLVAGAAHAQLSPEWERCIDGDSRSAPEVVFGACNTVISQGNDVGGKLARAYAKRGNTYQDKGEYDSAIADYTKAVEIDPKYAVAYNNRGFAYRAKGDLDNAIADYGKVIEINPSDAIAYFNRGIAFRVKGDNDRAIADYTKAIECDPELAGAYNNRGIAYRSKGDNDSAIADHTKAIDIDPEVASAYYNRALAYRAKGDNDHAIEDATTALEINPKHAGAYFARGLAHAAKGDHDRAIADYTKVIEINPKHDAAYQHRSLAYRAKGDADAALADYVRATEIIKQIAAAATSPGDSGQAPAAALHKAALTAGDGANQPFTLVLKTDLGAQQLTVIENDIVVHVWPISSGARGHNTPTGTFQPQSAHRMWYSRQYDWTPMPYAVFFVRGVAFHGTTATSRLGRSASHGCVRLATSNAAQLFDLVHKHGFAKTQIVVFGAATHDPTALASRAPGARGGSTVSSDVPGWVKTLFNLP